MHVFYFPREIVRFHGLDNLITLLSNTSEEAVSNAACVLTNIAQTELLRANALAKSVVTSLIVPLRSRCVRGTFYSVFVLCFRQFSRCFVSPVLLLFVRQCFWKKRLNMYDGFD